MKEKMTKIYAKGNKNIILRVTPGHFVTPQSHITHYLDMTTMRSRVSEAQAVAKELANKYQVSTPVDTIVCMDSLEVIGAFLAEELTKAGVHSMNAHQTIYVTSPEFNSQGQILFRDNIQPMIKGKKLYYFDEFCHDWKDTAKRNREYSLLWGRYSRCVCYFQRSEQGSWCGRRFYFQTKRYTGLLYL